MRSEAVKTLGMIWFFTLAASSRPHVVAGVGSEFWLLTTEFYSPSSGVVSARITLYMVSDSGRIRDIDGWSGSFRPLIRNFFRLGARIKRPSLRLPDR